RAAGADRRAPQLEHRSRDRPRVARRPRPRETRQGHGERRRHDFAHQCAGGLAPRAFLLMSTLICGSIAYDTIMVFHDRFKNHILPDQLHILNVAFLVPDMRREFGGCAGNIAYTLDMLGGDPLIMATVGDDYAPYASRLESLGISQRHIRKVQGTYTAQAFITTDLDDNQITAFHPGAMNHSHANHVREAEGVKLAIIAPDGRDGMLQHARECHDRGVP